MFKAKRLNIRLKHSTWNVDLLTRDQGRHGIWIDTLLFCKLTCPRETNCSSRYFQHILWGARPLGLLISIFRLRRTGTLPPSAERPVSRVKREVACISTVLQIACVYVVDIARARHCFERKASVVPIVVLILCREMLYKNPRKLKGIDGRYGGENGRRL